MTTLTKEEVDIVIKETQAKLQPIILQLDDLCVEVGKKLGVKIKAEFKVDIKNK